MRNIFVLLAFFNIQLLLSQNDVLENLGEMVNSQYSEFDPKISPDGKSLYFTREGHPKNTKYATNKDCQDIWFSQYINDSTWSEAKKLQKPLNQNVYNSIFNISPDGNTLLVRGAYDDKDRLIDGFSLSHKSKEGWGKFIKQDIKSFSKMHKGLYYGGFLSNDGAVLLLYFSENKNSELMDLYVAFKLGANSWSVPVKIPDPISTELDEFCPFLASDGVTLYFSSNRKGSIGNNDIYMSKRLDDSWLRWSMPINLGKPINSQEFEAYYSIDAKGEFAYLSKTVGAGQGTDIYRIKLKEDVKPNPVVLISGRVLNSKTSLPLDAEIFYEILPEGSPAGQARTNPVDGSYKIILPYGKNYGFSARAQGYIAVSDNLDLTAVAAYKEEIKDLSLVPIEVGQTIRLNNIFFDLAKIELRVESYPELDRVVNVLQDNQLIVIEIAGHSDNVGPDYINLKLSQGRAAAVRDYIVSKGIAPERVSSKGYGKEKPIAGNDTEEGRQLNRRVEFTILKN